MYSLSYAITNKNLLACERYRAGLIGLQLQKLGVNVAAEVPPRSDINVFMKHWKKNEGIMMDCPGIKVFDVCNDHFNTHRDHLYRNAIESADYVTCNTQYTKERIFCETGVEATMIPDPYEYEERPAKVSFETLPKICWFGHGANIREAESVPIPQHDGETSEIAIVSSEDCSHLMGYQPWSVAAVSRWVQWADLVVLPISPHNVARSANRTLNALRLGRFVISNPMPAYHDLYKFMWIGAGLKSGIRWAFMNQEEAQKRIIAGQNYIRDTYSPKAIAMRWHQFFLDICTHRA